MHANYFLVLILHDVFSFQLIGSKHIQHCSNNILLLSVLLVALSNDDPGTISNRFTVTFSPNAVVRCVIALLSDFDHYFSQLL